MLVYYIYFTIRVIGLGSCHYGHVCW